MGGGTFRAAIRCGLAVLLLPLTGTAHAALSFTVGGDWPNPAHRQAAVDAVQSSINRYNAFGDFGNYNVYVYYNAGIPTAQASYGGSIGFGGTYPNERVTMHEMAHYLGLPSGNWGGWMSDGLWDGAIATRLVKQFEGDQATLNGDGAHFWPYGLNYDSEGSELAKRRQVAVVYAMRADLGIGPAAHPSTATTISLTSSDAAGESGFFHNDRWSDGYFAHAGANYRTGNFVLRTPASNLSFTFAGTTLTVDNMSSRYTGQGLHYYGSGTSAVTTISDLRLDGGYIHHMSGLGDLFQLAGNLTVVSSAGIRAKQGNINILARVQGNQPLTIYATDAPTENNRYVRWLANNNTFTGNLINQGRFELAAGANFRFDIGASGANNAISGSTAQATLINGVFNIDLSDASYGLSDSWSLVSAANRSFGASFSVAGFTAFGNVWRNELYAFDEATGLLTVDPGSDLNNDGMIDLADYSQLLANNLMDLSSYSVAERAARGDIDLDGDNDFGDFRLFKQQYELYHGAGAFASLGKAIVPEPSAMLTLSLLCTATALAGWRRQHC